MRPTHATLRAPVAGDRLGHVRDTRERERDDTVAEPLLDRRRYRRRCVDRQPTPGQARHRVNPLKVTGSQTTIRHLTGTCLSIRQISTGRQSFEKARG